MSQWTDRWPIALLAALVFAAFGIAGVKTPLVAAEKPMRLAPPALDNPRVPGAPQTAVLAGGCFWGVQGVFEHVRGVRQVLAGYAGGEKSTAQYETVSSGTTAHAESVKIIFDPAQVSYGQLLQIAFSVVHDPTQLNRQGPDVGTQYRSAVFYTDDTQKRIAEAYIRQLDEAHAYPRPIVTRVDPLTGFFPAEGYHQDYLIHHPNAPYIAFFDLPKVENFKQGFPELYNERPVMAGGS
jgi:peptide-methionine (S)-S-oxide reductase